MQASSRRTFLGSSAAAMVAATTCGRESATAEERPRLPLIGFTKPFAHLSFDDTADLVAEVGWDGVEVAVRDGASTHIRPDRVADDLPRMVEALRRRGRELSIVTTSVVAVDAAGRRVLEATAAAGIPRVRLGFLKYPADCDPTKRVAELHAALVDVAAVCRDLGLQAGYQNHSGAEYVGAAVWDLHEALCGIDPRQVGSCFDIAHATVEGGLAWPLHARLMADRLVAVFCKDFFWERSDGGQKLRWCPLGEGVVQKSFFGWLRTTGFSGPISQHHEYGGLGAGADLVARLRRDLERLREWVAA
ncbi:MAG: sugar phosphate isomerase/epimerase family protein [Planctomycetaceae bacterium]